MKEKVLDINDLFGTVSPLEGEDKKKKKEEEEEGGWGEKIKKAEDAKRLVVVLNVVVKQVQEVRFLSSFPIRSVFTRVQSLKDICLVEPGICFVKRRS